MHLMPSWYPYIDWNKSDMKVTVLKSDTPQEIKDEFAKYLEELKKPKKGFVDKQLCFQGHSNEWPFISKRVILGLWGIRCGRIKFVKQTNIRNANSN